MKRGLRAASSLSCTWQTGKQEKVPGSEGTQQLTLELK